MPRFELKATLVIEAETREALRERIKNETIFDLLEKNAEVGEITFTQPEGDEDKIDEAYRAAAKEQWQKDGEIEIDPGATVSVSDDGGAYVQAWVWVYDDAANVCSECRAELTDDGEGYDGKCGSCADKEAVESGQ